MLRRIFQYLASVLALTAMAAERPTATKDASGESVRATTPAADSGATESPPVSDATAASRPRVVIIPVREAVDTPLLYILRRGLKQAIDDKAEMVVLDMKTPGGALDVTFEIMEAIAKFPGKTVTFINPEALSAGAFISASTQEIWFAPNGVIGAAAPVLATGGEIDESMKQKVVSYLKARVRADSEGKGHRGKVISAMIDANYELKIDDKVLKEKGELLSLTASEAAELHGDPAEPLLAAGIAKDVDDLLAQKFGANGYTATRLEVTWSEHFAVFLRGLAPLLLGVGMLALYIEFKTPGFGVFGIVGIACLAIVFISNFVAGLSGHEPMLVFGAGLVLVFVELFFFPGIIIVALTGMALMLGALVWSMADLWPNEPLSVAWSEDVFVGPLSNLGFGLLIAVALGIALIRFMPRGWIWDKMVIQSTISGSAQTAGGDVDAGMHVAALVGREGVAATGLRPGGQIEIDGHRYEARAELGAIERGRPVVVRAYSDFGLIVEEKR